MVDVGFGGTGPIRPILLADGGEGHQQLTPDVDRDGGRHTEPRAGWVWGTYPPERHRLVRGTLPGSSLGATSDTHPHTRTLTSDMHTRVALWLGVCSPARLAPPGVTRVRAASNRGRSRTRRMDAAVHFQRGGVLPGGRQCGELRREPHAGLVLPRDCHLYAAVPRRLTRAGGRRRGPCTRSWRCCRCIGELRREVEPRGRPCDEETWGAGGGREALLFGEGKIECPRGSVWSGR